MMRKIVESFGRRIKSTIAPPSSWEIYKDYVKIHPTAVIDPTASIQIFNPPDPPRICLEIGEESHIFSSFALLRPQAKIIVGKRCQLGNSQFISADAIQIGNDVIMAWGCTVIDSDNHSIYWNERQRDVNQCRKNYIETHGADIARVFDWNHVKIEPVVIGDKTWIGFNAIILKGVTVGEGAVIGAGSVVTHSVEPWHIGAGNPFKHIRKIGIDREP